MSAKKIGLVVAVAGGFLVVVGGIGLVTVGRNVGQFFFGRSFAESQLREYVTRVLNQDVNGVNCQNFDTDGNHYVSCDYTTTAAPERVRSIECSAWGLDGFLNRGCKVRLPGDRFN